MDKSTKQYQVWFKHSSDKHSSIVSSFDTMGNALGYMASVYHERVDQGYAMIPRIAREREYMCWSDYKEISYYSEYGKWGFRYWVVDSNDSAPVARDLSQTALDVLAPVGI